MEVIPRQLADNAGFDAINILNKLRHKHATGNTWFGVDIQSESVADNMEGSLPVLGSVLLLFYIFWVLMYCCLARSRTALALTHSLHFKSLCVVSFSLCVGACAGQAQRADGGNRGGDDDPLD